MVGLCRQSSCREADSAATRGGAARNTVGENMEGWKRIGGSEEAAELKTEDERKSEVDI